MDNVPFFLPFFLLEGFPKKLSFLKSYDSASHCLGQTHELVSFNHGLSPNEYKFEKNEELLDDTGLYADAGSNWRNDKVPGSRTIFLRLEDGDRVAVRQTRANYVLDHHISFCGALIHLKKVRS